MPLQACYYSQANQLIHKDLPVLGNHWCSVKWLGSGALWGLGLARAAFWLGRGLIPWAQAFASTNPTALLNAH